MKKGVLEERGVGEDGGAGEDAGGRCLATGLALQLWHCNY